VKTPLSKGAYWASKLAPKKVSTVFDDPHALLLDDPLHSAEESRFLLLGFSAFARKKETRDYEKKI
jgi:hypothetical protein